MIVVIADDLTGAAEMAGVAFRCGLSAEVQTQFDPSSPAKLVAIDTNTRSCDRDQAKEILSALAGRLSLARPELIFKKVDSVLRGPVLTEITALMRALQLDRSILAPANPSLGRTIVGGQYFIDGSPIHETHFADDPEHPRESSNVADMLGAVAGISITSVRPQQELQGTGVFLGDCRTATDVALWAQAVDDTVLPAGAADFFAAILKSRGLSSGRTVRPVPADDGAKTLYVCGSASAASQAMLAESERTGVPVLRIPVEVFEGQADPKGPMARWSEQVCMALKGSDVVVTAIGREFAGDAQTPQRLTDALVQHVMSVLQQCQVERLYVEGGATASALIRELGYRQLSVYAELAPGVVSLEVRPPRGMIVTMKPGSYPWPAEARSHK